MPYASNSDLPAQTADLPSAAKTVFRRVFNDTSKSGKSEEISFAYAWKAVKNGWKKNNEGKWEKLQKSDDSLLTKSNFHDISVISDIFKSDEEQRIVYGWASVVTKNNEPVVDLHGDVITPSELLSATTEFMKTAHRNSLNMHRGEPVGQVVHSFPLTYEIAKSLDIETENEGWIVGVHVTDDATWNLVKSGALSAFSIGGKAIRKEID